MKKNFQIVLVLIFIFINATARTQDVAITKITEKVIVANLWVNGNGSIIAISSQKGIIVVDTESSPRAMKIIKDAIQKEFPGEEFAYVINTHAHAHHCGGNAVFKNLPIIAHENIVEDMQWWFDLMQSGEKRKNWQEYMQGKIAECDAEIESQEASSVSIQANKRFWEGQLQEIKQGFEIVEPNIRFTNEMTLALGDMTLHLIYFGKGHSKSDILIHIPEEKVLISGATISPNLPWTHHKGDRERDLLRWMSVLEMLTNKLDQIDYVIPGHSGTRNKQAIKMHFEYFTALVASVQLAQKKGLTLDEATAELSLSKRFSEVAQFQNLSKRDQERHPKNVEVFWNYYQK